MKRLVDPMQGQEGQETHSTVQRPSELASAVAAVAAVAAVSGTTALWSASEAVAAADAAVHTSIAKLKASLARGRLCATEMRQSDVPQTSLARLDATRRAIATSLQRLQTEALTTERDAMHNAARYRISIARTISTHVALAVQTFTQDADVVVRATAALRTKSQAQVSTLSSELTRFSVGVLRRIQELWVGLSQHSATVDECNTASNTARIEVSAALAAAPTNIHEPGQCVALVALLQRHWTAVAEFLQTCPSALSAPLPAQALADGMTQHVREVRSKRQAAYDALRKNTERQFFCAKSRIAVLQAPSKNTPAWVSALKRWERGIQELEVQATVLRARCAELDDRLRAAGHITGSAHGGVSMAAAAQLHDIVPVAARHRKWKEALAVLARYAASIEERARALADTRAHSSAYIMTLAKTQMRTALEAARKKVSVTLESFRSVESNELRARSVDSAGPHAGGSGDIAYMTQELQMYGPQGSAVVAALERHNTWQRELQHEAVLSGQLTLMAQLTLEAQ
jgi:hypothetical protein